MKQTCKNQIKHSKTGGSTSTLFKPLVASSLALALSMSVASAACSIDGASFGICTDPNASVDAPQKDKNVTLPLTLTNQPSQSFILEAGTSTNDGFVMPLLQMNSNTKHNIDKLTFQFGANGKSAVEASGDTSNLIIATKNNDHYLGLESGTGKGFQVGANGSGTLVFDFATNTAADIDYVMKVNVSSPTGDQKPQTSLKGNIEVLAKAGQATLGTGADSAKNRFIADFEKGITGNIIIGKDASSNENHDLLAKLLFGQVATIGGNVTTNGKGVVTNLTFQNNGTISGNVTTGEGAQTNVALTKDNGFLTLEGINNQITTLKLEALGGGGSSSTPLTAVTLKLKGGASDNAKATTEISGGLTGASKDNKLTVNFLEGHSKLILGGAAENKVQALVLGANTTSTLEVKGKGTTINAAVTANANQNLNLKVTGEKLGFVGALAANSGLVDVTLAGDTAKTTGILDLQEGDNTLSSLAVTTGKHGTLKLKGAATAKATTITGNVSGGANVVFGENKASLALEGTNNVLGDVSTTAAATGVTATSAATLTIGKTGATENATTTINSIGGNLVDVTFATAATKTTTLNLGGTSTIKTLTASTAGTSALNVTGTSTTILQAVSLTGSQKLDVTLAGDTAKTTGILDLQEGDNTLSSLAVTTGKHGTLKLKGAATAKATTITGNVSGGANVVFGENKASLALEGTNNVLGDVSTTAAATGVTATSAATLTIGKTGATENATTTINSIGGNLVDVTFATAATKTTTLNLGGTSTIKTLTASTAGTSALNVTGTSTTILQAVSLTGSQKLDVTLAGDTAKTTGILDLQEGDNTLSSLAVTTGKHGTLKLKGAATAKATTITGNVSGGANVVFGENKASLALEGTNNVLGDVSTTAAATGVTATSAATLTIGKTGATENATTTINSIGGNLVDVTFATAATKTTTLNLGGTSTIKTLTASTAGTSALNVTGTSTTILQAVSLTGSQKLDVTLAGDTAKTTGILDLQEGDNTLSSLAVTTGKHGTLKLKGAATAKATTITGNVSGGANVVFGENKASLALEGTNNVLGDVSTTAAATGVTATSAATLTIGKTGATENATTTINSIGGNLVDVTFATAATKTTTLNLGGTSTIKTLTASTAGTSALNVTGTSTTILQAVSLTGSQKLDVTLAGDTAKTTGILDLQEGDNTLSSLAVTTGKHGTLKLKGAATAKATTITGNVSGGANVVFGENKASLALEGTNNVLGDVSTTAAATGVTATSAATLTIGKTGATENATTTINSIGGNLVDVTFATAATKTTTLNLGGTSTIKTLTASTAGTSALNVTGTSTTILQAVSLTGSQKLDVTLNSGATLALRGTDNKITSLSREATPTGTATLDISSKPANDAARSSHTYNKLEIGSLDNTKIADNSYTFKVYASAVKAASGDVYADRIVISNELPSGTATQQNLEIDVDSANAAKELGNKIKELAGQNKGIALVTLKDTDGSKSVITFATDTVKNGQNISFKLKKGETDKNGGNYTSGDKYATYFLYSADLGGANAVTQQITSSALALNFDLFTANFNSINKRLGDLRNNPYNQGVWARVFGGSQESNFGVKTKTSYVTAQGGYDYALDLDNAKNYIGVALSYATSFGKSLTLKDKDGASRSLDDIKSRAFEVAVYNSYISNVGLYNDTIAKFSYITSDFKISGDQSTTGTTSSPAFLLSNEVGYRFALGENNSWFIDPQLEIGLGYLSASDFKAMLDGTNELTANQQSVLLVRSRAGASFGKEFRGEDWATSLYVGTFYEYDVINGGQNKVTFANNNLATPTESYTSNGRFVLNVGTNVEVAEATRIYLDVETNFGDIYKKLYQVNVGARYSFGDKATKATMTDKEDNKAPLKVQTTEEKEGTTDVEDTQESTN
ncbi:hypothetical protein BBW65_05930 [Helicobacter enhydrae]|uniref:Autotransporter domain-containing protein n=1 Tax=Helicobacter enhydrae TaxID=222136 RepID=A0A1B1U6E3_9HELI|nr:autotransporter outer membrane beta-barrel domain-containing protein [Helicobacter enhydrae]ANV98364.1 hypothetical protein BBW65_05930 [Helicobacter enhydrae]